MIRKFVPLTGMALASLAMIFGDGANTTDAANTDTSACCQSRKQITPPCECLSECAVGLEINADYILWTPRQAGLEYAVTPSASADVQGTVEQPGFKLSSGFKVGLGLLTEHDGWKVDVQYTWLNSRTNDASYDATAEGTTTNGMWGSTQPLVGYASETWKLNFNVIDGMWGRCFWISEWLQLTPSLGIKGTWQTQKLNLTQRNTAETIITNFYNKQRVSGAGIRFGFNTGWYFNRCWSLQGGFALSSVYSKYHVTSYSDTATVADPTVITSTTVNTTNTFYNVVPVTELNLALQWEAFFGDMNEYRFLLRAGWEEQVWGSQNMFNNTNERGNHGDLSLQGFTLHAAFDF